MVLAQGAFLTTRVSCFPGSFWMAVPGGNSPAAHTVRQAQHQLPENLRKRPCMSEKALLYQFHACLGCSSFLFLTESSKSPASIAQSNKQWVGTCLYQEWCKPLLISCEAAFGYEQVAKRIANIRLTSGGESGQEKCGMAGVFFVCRSAAASKSRGSAIQGGLFCVSEASFEHALWF